MTIVNEKNIQACNDASMFNSGNVIEMDAQNAVNAFESHFERLKDRLGGEWNEKQAEIIQSRKADYTALVSSRFNELASRRASNPSWMVTGPAKYNFSRHDKLFSAMLRKDDEWQEKQDRFLSNTADMLKNALTKEQQIEYWRKGRNMHGEAIDAADPLAIEKLEAHIQYMEEKQKRHVAMNKYIRKNGTLRGFEGVSEATAAIVEENIKQWPYRQHTYFFSDAANIRAKKQRLELLKKQKSEAVAEDISQEKDGVKMSVNAEAARVQIFFPGKPDEETRSMLKSNGFRWSPRFGAWQRENTPRGVAVAKEIFKKLVA